MCRKFIHLTYRGLDDIITLVNDVQEFPSDVCMVITCCLEMMMYIALDIPMPYYQEPLVVSSLYQLPLTGACGLLIYACHQDGSCRCEPDRTSLRRCDQSANDRRVMDQYIYKCIILQTYLKTVLISIITILVLQWIQQSTTERCDEFLFTVIPLLIKTDSNQ